MTLSGYSRSHRLFHGYYVANGVSDSEKTIAPLSLNTLLKLLISIFLAGSKNMAVHPCQSMVTVRWKDCQSALFQVKSEVRQGGVLSPILFTMYIDIVVEALVKSDLSCHVMRKYFGCLLYADDLIVLSASVLQLQKMLDLRYDRRV